MNGTPPGTWNAQSGYGLINAIAAINAIAPPTLASTSIFLTGTAAMIGQQVTLTATVSGSSGTPTGSLDFYDTTINTDLGTVTLSGGVATLIVTPPVSGSHVYLVTTAVTRHTPKTPLTCCWVVTATPPAVVRPDSSPVNGGFPTLIDSQVVDGVAVSIAALAASESKAPVKKQAT